MSWPKVPTTFGTDDWPRKIANAVNDLLRRADALEKATDWAALQDFPDDAAAATGGVSVGQLYRTGNNVRVRVT
mgnify:CR=1 FL=1|jgi:hypothetical protein